MITQGLGENFGEMTKRRGSCEFCGVYPRSFFSSSLTAQLPCPSSLADALFLEHLTLPFIPHLSSDLPPLGSLLVCHLALWSLSDFQVSQSQALNSSQGACSALPSPSLASSINSLKHNPLGTLRGLSPSHLCAFSRQHWACMGLWPAQQAMGADDLAALQANTQDSAQTRHYTMEKPGALNSLIYSLIHSTIFVEYQVLGTS